MGGFIEFEGKIGEFRVKCIRWIITALVMAMTCVANAEEYENPFINDYARLFRDMGAKAQTLDNGNRVLDMPGGVTVTEMRRGGKVSYLAMDRGSGGAVGCTQRILVDLVAVADLCPGFVTDKEKKWLNEYLALVSEYVAKKECLSAATVRLAGCAGPCFGGNTEKVWSKNPGKMPGSCLTMGGRRYCQGAGKAVGLSRYAETADGFFENAAFAGGKPMFVTGWNAP